MNEHRLQIVSIKRDFALQPRATLNRDWIEEYALDMANGAAFPPPVVFLDGNDYWLADGFHRVFAAEALGLVDIACDIRRGTRRDALLFSVGANAVHGHRRTNDDKRRAVDIMLNDPEWSRLPDREIARYCAVTHPFVSTQRPKPPSGNDCQIPEPRLVTRGGTTYPMNTRNIGNASRERNEPDPPPDSDPQPYQPRAPITFDHDAAHIRHVAMETIRALAALPPPPEVIAAWNKTMGFGEPFETFEKAQAWLEEFTALYREAEPIRWAKVQRAREKEMSHAAE